MTRLAEKVDKLNITIKWETGIIFKELASWNATGLNRVRGEFFQQLQRSTMVYQWNQSRGKNRKLPGYIYKALTTLKNKTTV